MARLIRLYSANVLFASGLFFYSFLYEFFLDTLGHSVAVMGYATASVTAGGLLALLPAGQLVDRRGPRTAFLVAAALTVAGLVSSAAAARPLAVYGAGVLVGAGTSTWRVAVGPSLMHLSDSGTRARAFAWNVGLLVGAGALWTALAGKMPAWAGAVLGVEGLAAYRAAVLAGALGTAASVAVFWRVALPRRTLSAADGRPAYSTSLVATAPSWGGTSPRRLLVVVLLVAVWMTAPALVLPFTNIFFQQQHGLPIGQIGVVFGIGQVLTAAAVVGSGELATRFGPLRTLAGWSLVFGPTVWALAATDAVGLAAALYMLQGMVAPSTFPLVDQVLLEKVPAERYGTVSSWRNIATETSGMVGASVGGVVLNATSYAALFVSAGALGVAAALAMLSGFRWLVRAQGITSSRRSV